MVVRHGALLGLGEIAKTIGGKGLGKYGSEVRDIPVSCARFQDSSVVLLSEIYY